VGGVLLGDTTITGPVKKAIEEKTDLSTLVLKRPSGSDVIEFFTGKGP
jgi:hypothetical protein